MHRRFSLLRRLADGAPVSGTVLASELGISRGAVWQQVENLRRDGVEIRSDAEGYRLAEPFRPYAETALAAALEGAAAAAIRTISIDDVTASTNDDLLGECDRGGDVHGVLRVAELQTRGRGRRGDPWLAAPGGSVCLSLGWRFETAPPDLPAAGLVVGIAAAEALAGLTGVPIKVKWPNDLVVAGRKLGGILVELKGELAGPCTVIIGIGLNVRLGTAVRESVERPLTDLNTEGASHDRNALIAAVMNALVPALEIFVREGFAPFCVRWPEHDGLTGRRVRIGPVPERGAAVEGTAAGVSAGGALKVRTAGGEVPVFAGHVELVE